MSYVAMGITAGAAGFQIIKGAQEKKKAREEKARLEASMPKYAGSGALDQYYQQSLQAANTAPTQSALYKQQQQQINRQMGMGLSGAGGQGAVARLVQGANDASMRNIVASENLKEQRMGRLGSIVGQKASEDRLKFQINQQQPWETKYSDVIAQGVAGAQTQQMGFQNLSGALNNFGAIQGSKDYLKQYAKMKKNGDFG